MRRTDRIFKSVFAFCMVLGLHGTAVAFVNPLDQAAMNSTLATTNLLHAITTAGDRIVAVGVRGHIVTSDDAGKSWRQARVPVSSDLLAVSFPTAKHGWAVGHGGVVLHSSDGGVTWSKQLDGRQTGALAVRHYEEMLASGKRVEQVLGREKSLVAEGGAQALLDVYFESPSHGFVVGTFNRIYRTTDGGKTWTPWMERTGNDKELHFYAIHGGPHGIYLAGERGMVWRYDSAKERFIAIQTPYQGTLFGVVVYGPESLLVFGMRGSLLSSTDSGRSWAQVVTNSPAGITSGTVMPDGSLVVVNQAGGIKVSRDRGKTFQAISAPKAMPFFGVTALGDKRVGLVGPEGVTVGAVQ